MQNQPNPDTPVHERRWLDRLRAAWDGVQARPKNNAKAGELEAVAQERPEEANYRIGTFAADAALRQPDARKTNRKSPLRRKRDESERPSGQATPETDRFDDEAGR